MCGIAGISGSVSAEFLYEMLDAIKHRGPDNRGTWVDCHNSIALGHQRLSIIDLSAEAHQPMWTKDGRYCIVYNGELYNFKEIRRELAAKGFHFATKSDTEVLLALFREKSFAMLSSLNGVFAFAIWDAVKKDLFLARDPMGVKPLYYTELQEEFVFSSEIKAILKNKGVSRKINPKAVHNHMMLLWSPQPETIFCDVKKVEAGEALIVRDGRIVKKWHYFEIPFNGDYVNIAPQEAAEELRFLLLEAVKRQMVGDVPIAFSLSGGLDSSSLLALAKHNFPLEKDFPCYTIALPPGEQEADGFADDLQYARIVARDMGCSLEEVPAKSDLVKSLEAMVYALDEPQADFAALHVATIAEKARSEGYKVLISGLGGDDLFSGYLRHLSLLFERYWAWLPRSVRASLSHVTSLLSPHRPWSRRCRRVFSNAALDHEERLCAYFLHATEERVRSLYSGRFREILGDYSAITPLKERLKNIDKERNTLNKMLFLEQKFFLTDHNLNYSDKMSMLHGVEMRVPFLDLEVVRFADQLPPYLKCRRGVLKWILKKAMEGLVPEEIITRPKTGFGVPLRKWFSEGFITGEKWSNPTIPTIFDENQLFSALQKTSERKEDLASSLLSVECMNLFFRRHNMYL